jgi:hypothetical protein
MYLHRRIHGELWKALDESPDDFDNVIVNIGCLRYRNSNVRLIRKKSPKHVWFRVDDIVMVRENAKVRDDTVLMFFGADE